MCACGLFVLGVGVGLGGRLSRERALEAFPLVSGLATDCGLLVQRFHKLCVWRKPADGRDLGGGGAVRNG